MILSQSKEGKNTKATKIHELNTEKLFINETILKTYEKYEKHGKQYINSIKTILYFPYI